MLRFFLLLISLISPFTYAAPTLLVGDAYHIESSPGGSGMGLDYRGIGIDRDSGQGFSHVEFGELIDTSTLLNGRVLEVFSEAVAPVGNPYPGYTGYITLSVGELYNKIIISVNNGEFVGEFNYSRIYNNSYIYEMPSSNNSKDFWLYLDDRIGQHLKLEVVHAE